MTRFVLVAIAALALTANPAFVRADDGGVIRFVVDVAEDFDAFFTSTPVSPSDTQPVRGSWFLTEGYLYKGGTIEGDGSTFIPGSGRPIGKWICRGTHLVSLTEILDGAPLWVTTHQIYLFPDDGRTLTTDGVEGAIPLSRAVTGGTGAFRHVTGEQQQQFLGLNPRNGVNLRVTFVLRRNNP